MEHRKILIWLPSPIGDAVLSTPALRAIRQKYKDDEITFLANATVKAILSDSGFNDHWQNTNGKTLRLASALRKAGFTDAVLLKNSFGSALTVFLAGIKNRTGYARDKRSPLLTNKIATLKNPDGTIKPYPMVDYYLKIAESLGCKTNDTNLELSINDEDQKNIPPQIREKLNTENPIVILVPGGAFGPSKCWPADRYAWVAKLLKQKYNAEVLVSVAPNEPELEIAETICSVAAKSVNLAEYKLSLGQLKAIFSKSDLVITNDTGPRHIAIALKRKLITLFGPNDPAWTQTGYSDEIQIVGSAYCLPCAKPHCFQKKHICMESITTDKVMQSVEKIIGKGNE